MRNMEAPRWQTAPKKWGPLAVQPRTSYTVVGGRKAKKEQTAVVVQCLYHLELDKEYMDNRPGGSPIYLSMCHTSNWGPYIDLRIYRTIVFLYQVHSQCNAGPYTSVLNGLQDRTAADGYQERAGNTIVWSAHEPTGKYWDHAAGLPETTITITTTLGPHGRWVDIGAAAQSADKYHVRCKHHECPGPNGLADTFIHVHGQAAVRQEVQDAMRVLLAELYASNAPGDTCPDAEYGHVRLHLMPVREGPQTYLEPRLEPGLHFHTLPDLATIRGYILAMDAARPMWRAGRRPEAQNLLTTPKVWQRLSSRRQEASRSPIR